MRLLLDTHKLPSADFNSSFHVCSRSAVHLHHRRNKESASAGACIHNCIERAYVGDPNKKKLSQMPWGEDDSKALFFVSARVPEKLAVELTDYIYIMVSLEEGPNMAIDVTNQAVKRGFTLTILAGKFRVCLHKLVWREHSHSLLFLECRHQWLRAR